MKYKIAQVVVGLPVEGPFDYLIPRPLRGKVGCGQRVEVPFGPRRLTGTVVGLLRSSRVPRLKPIRAVLDPVPVLDADGLELAKRFAGFYGCSLGEAIATSLPAAMKTKRPVSFTPPPASPSRGKGADGGTLLCHDEGLSECWPFIAGEMRVVLEQGKSVLFLVPESSSAVQAAERLRPHLPEPPLRLDRQLTPKEELGHWISVREGRSRVVIGTRSAVFAPMVRPGLIVVYEEENPSYKQEQTPFYHVRDVVLLRSRIEKCPVAFISAAPSVELWHLSRKRKARTVHFKAPRLAQVRLIDLTNYKMRKRASVSFPLQNAITEVLARKGKVVLLLNRRGFSTMIRCNKCGHTVRCPRCDVNLTFVYSRKKLACPLCRSSSDLPEVCPECRTAYLRYLGAGTEKVESEVARLFPEARIARFDRDTASWPSHADIVIATQAVVRKTGEAAVNTVGLLDVDAELSRVDYRSTQRVFSSLVRLRQLASEDLFIQTAWRDHPCFRAAAKMDFAKFYREELKSRRECRLPPFTRLVAVGFRGVRKEQVADCARAVFEKLKEGGTAGMEVLDLQPDIIPKLRDKYRFTIMVKGKAPEKIIPAIKAVMKAVGKKGKVIETINVDP